MAIPVLTNVRTFAGGADLTSQSNEIELEGEFEEKDATTFGSNGWKECKAGLGSGSLKGKGLWQAGDLSLVDDQAWAALGGLDAYSVFATTAGVGDTAYLLKGMEKQYATFDQVGEIIPWTLDVSSSWPVTRGKGLHSPGDARITSGTGTIVEHVAVSATQNLYAALHVLSVSGTVVPTITVRIESDALVGFGSATTVLTFNAATAIGGQITRVAGPITDTFYRAAWTISGTNPSFLFVVTFAVA